MKKSAFVWTALPIVVLAAWTAFHAVNSTIGEEITVPVSGYDPRDLLSGHYLTYRVDYPELDTEGCYGDPAYLCLDTGRTTREKPADCKLVLKGRCAGWGTNRFVAGVERFYIPEDHAETLDRALRAGEAKAEIRLFVARSGKGYVKDMLFDGVPAKEFAKTAQDN